MAFNLNNDATNGRTAPIDFYFDDLSWEYLKLEDGFFVSGIDTNTNPKGEYDDLDTAIQFEEGVDPDGDPCLVATVGESGKYVDQIILSTKRGDDEAYKGNALMVSDKIVPGEWVDYTSSSNARINLPGLGVWKIYLDTEYSSLLFELVEGSMYETIEINPNPIVYTVNAGERDWLVADNNGNAREGEEGNIGTGQTYNNQMFIKANSIMLQLRMPKFLHSATPNQVLTSIGVLLVILTSQLKSSTSTRTSLFLMSAQARTCRRLPSTCLKSKQPTIIPSRMLFGS